MYNLQDLARYADSSAREVERLALSAGDVWTLHQAHVGVRELVQNFEGTYRWAERESGSYDLEWRAALKCSCGQVPLGRGLERGGAGGGGGQRS